jgi:hypothetical protein
MEIKVNSKGNSKLLLHYPLELRLRAKTAAQSLGISEQALIRQGIEQIVTAWETSQPVKKTRGRRKAGVK